MQIDWVHAWPAGTAAFLASLVEFVEALTVILAVGATRGWRDALAGAAAAAFALSSFVAALGPAMERLPLRPVQLAVGTLLLLFGLRWLRKAALRAAGVVALHDEDAAFRAHRDAMGAAIAHRGFDAVAFGASFKITMLEGLEVVFIVVAVGAGGADLLVPAASGALAAFVVVAALGLAVHRPLSRVPENALKFTVGAILSAFGTFWVGEGAGTHWAGGDLVLVPLTLFYLAGGVYAAAIAERLAGRPAAGARGGVL